ncbi:hypothetical protein [Sporosalibacterium faouarense]|uniref:hypothetical protein n=1 Tax=Sporosalibacterium faouarense TaxID=516123 RepID=UPI00141C85AC|nr:hypothetical protein [Sporosalibacterium faouarense]MTI47953.1 hypothetical protein [Bacillota bacterium]
MNLINIIHITFSVFVFMIGLVICALKIKEGNIYKYGIWFFSLRIIIVVLDFIKNYFFIPYIMRNTAYALKLGYVLQFISIPTILLGLVSYIILIFGLYNAYNGYKSNKLY